MSQPQYDRQEGVSSERTPLIPPDAPGQAPSTPPPQLKRLGVISTCILLLILVELGAYLAAIPLNQVLEETICRQSFSRLRPAPGDARCKDEAVQAELALVRGWQSTLDFLPGLATAVPYGFLADRRGREFVLALSLLGMTLASAFYILVCSLPSLFPVRATWLSAVFTFVGGGSAVFNAMVFTITGDVVSEEQRSAAFSYLAAAVIGGELMASPLVYFLMEKHLWLPIYLGLACQVLGTVSVFFLPETLPRKRRAELHEVPPSDPWLQKVQTLVANMGKTTLWLTWGHRKVAVLLFTFLLTTLGRFAQEILLQYVTKRYGWSWSKASLLLSVRACVNLALLMVIIPSASYLLVQKWTRSTQQSNLFLAWLSALLLTLGAFIVGLSETSVAMVCGLAVFGLGAGYNFVTRSLLASLVEKQHVAMLYTAISLMETVGALIAGPLLAVSFRIGMKWGGSWIGLPYIATGCLLTVATVAVTSIGLVGVESRTDANEFEEPR